jgi:CrcB protein
VTGCFLLAVLLYEALYTELLAEKMRVVFGTGFLSSYPTYSTFAVEKGVLTAIGIARALATLLA